MERKWKLCIMLPSFKENYLLSLQVDLELGSPAHPTFRNHSDLKLDVSTWEGAGLVPVYS